MKSFLVTGNMGFIGRSISKTLLDRGHSVRGIDEDLLNIDGWENSLLNLLNEFNPDGIFHVGACSNTLENRVQYMMVRNYQSTKVLMKWAKESNIPFIYSSSAANYGVDGLFPGNLYGWSKYVAEDFVISNGGTALRYFNVYGPGEEHKGNMASFFYQAIKISEKGLIPKIFPGGPKRDFIYIEDVIDANILAFENFNITQGKFFDVGTSTPRTFEDGLNILNLKYQYTELNAVPEGYQFFTCANLEKMLPNWSAKFDLEKGLNKYLLNLTTQNFS